MVKIRLKRCGRKKRPHYRIVAVDSRMKRDGRSIEDLGFYNTLTKHIGLKRTRILMYLGEGAQPSPTVKRIFQRVEII
jgi:small subunit ribosomal protein S16